VTLVDDIVQWIAVPASVNLFAWQLIIPLRVVLVVLLVHFIYTFIYQRSFSFRERIMAISVLAPVVALMPTTYNAMYFDLYNCEASLGALLGYQYIIEAVALLLITYICSKAYYRFTDPQKKSQAVLLLVGGVSFLLFLLGADIYSELTHFYEIYLIGPVGVLVFLVAMAYMIVKYHTFNVKVFATQALVVTLWILIGSLLLVVKSDASRIISLLTLVLTVIIGVNLIRSVRKEIEARELLAEANAGQERFIHFLSHEVKGFLTVARNGFASISEGDFGPVPDTLTAMAKNALSRVNDGVTTVESILKSANLKSGNVIYKFAPFDICAAIRKRLEIAQPLLQERKLTLETHLPEGDYVIVGDTENITGHVLKNLIENAIFYTPQGSITVALERRNDTVVFSVKDTGVGISPEDKKKLFTEGGRGANSTKVNAHSTGHGLFIVKNIVEAHGGRVWAHSEGEGKGTTFFVELPVNPPATQKK
jgi:signal transduction histidine kinase